MTPAQIKALATALFFLLILISGYGLSRLGKPYPTLWITLHKLIALGAAVYIGITVHRIHQATPLTPVQWIALAALIFFALITVITGGLASVDKNFPEIVTTTHHLGPYLTILSSIVFFFLAYS